MALHCRRVRDFFVRSFEGLEYLRDVNAKKEYLAGRIMQPMDGIRHHETLYDGYDANTATKIGAGLLASYRRLCGSIALDDRYRRAKRAEIDWESPTLEPEIDLAAVDSINESIIDTIFNSPKNLTYE